MKKILIFGCSGFVGRYVIEEFSSHGYLVYGTDQKNPVGTARKHLEDFRSIDLLNFDLVENYITAIKPDYIINLAAISSVGLSWSIPQTTINVNVNGSLNILESVRKLGLKTKILLVGSSEEYAISDSKINEEYPINANNPYGISKVTQEQFADLYRNEYGMNIINTRTFNHTGIGQPTNFAIPSFVKQVADIHNSHKSGIISVGNLGAYRDLGDVRDMASAYRMILESDTEKHVFNVGSGNCYHLEEILSYIVSLSDENIEIHVDPQKLRPLDNPVIWCDNTLLREEIGWFPKFTIYDAINSMFNDFTNNSLDE